MGGRCLAIICRPPRVCITRGLGWEQRQGAIARHSVLGHRACGGPLLYLCAFVQLLDTCSHIPSQTSGCSSGVRSSLLAWEGIRHVQKSLGT